MTNPWVWLVIAAGILYIPIAQRRMVKRPEWPWFRGAADVIAVYAGACAFLFFLGVFGNPLVAVGAMTAIMLFLPTLNRAKFRNLHEPIVILDAWLLRQIFQFPRFYFPYLPMWRLIICSIGVAALVVGFMVYDPLPELPFMARLGCVMASIGALLAAFGAAVMATVVAPEAWLRRFPVSANPADDVRRYGLIGSSALHCLWLVAYRRQNGRQVEPDEEGLSVECRWRDRVWNAAPKELPHVVLVQAESYVRLRNLLPDLPEVWTKNFDALAADGVSGLVAVGTFGAYTIRTEFSALTGLERSVIGPYSVNPYLLAARTKVGSLAWHLAGKGYETLCIHPNDDRFFDRRHAMPNFGFRRFAYGDAFGLAEKYGPYISDKALGKVIAGMLDDAKPQFIFAISIEAHGPWYEGRLADWAGLPDGEALPESLLDKRGPDGGMAAYARHLRHTDELLGELADELRKRKRPAVLAVYGDHPGAVPGVVDAAARKEPVTDYLIWRSDRSLSGRDNLPDGQTLAPSELGGYVLSACV